MDEKITETIVNELERSVAITPERRGFAKQRGVPDSVYWLAPATDRIPSHLIPILVELEGSFFDAIDDFKKFADRGDDTEYQHYLKWPILGVEDRPPISRFVQYDIIGIRATQLADQWSITERKMHDAFEDWCQRFQSEFQTSAQHRRYGATRTVEWQIEFTMFGHDVSTRVPFIVESGSNLDCVLDTRIETPSIPCVVVVNDKYDDRDTGEYYYETQIKFPAVPSVRLQKSDRF